MTNYAPPGHPATVKQEIKCGPIGEAFNEQINVKREIKGRINAISNLVNPAYRWREENEKDTQSIAQLRQTVGMYALAFTRGMLMSTMLPIGENPIRIDYWPDRPLQPTDPAFVECQEWLNAKSYEIWNYIRSGALNMRAAASGRGFMSASASAIDFSLTHGDVCMCIRNDFTFEVFRAEQWYVVRDGQGLELRLGVIRRVDPCTLPEHCIGACKFPEGWMKKPLHERMVKVFTDYQWQPNGKWKQTDECNGEKIYEAVHEEARYFPIPWHLIPGNQYGSAYFEACYAKLLSLDHLNGAKTDLVNICADAKFGIDRNSTIRPDRLIGPSGSFIEGAIVSSGIVQDIAPINLQKHQDLAEVRNEARLTEEDLAKGLGIDNELLPSGDRVTRLHVEEVVGRLNSTRDGSTHSFIETFSNKTTRAIYDVAMERGMFKNPPKSWQGKWSMRMTTGAIALARSANINKFAAFAQITATIKQAEISPRYSKESIEASIAEDMGLDLSKHRKTDAQMQQEQAAAEASAVRQAAALEAVKQVGPAVQSALVPSNAA